MSAVVAPEQPTVRSIGVDALIRALVVDPGRPVSMLLGAGASISSGMPSAERCVWEWKREIFVTNNPALRDAVGELSLPGTRTRIQRWLDQRGGYPPLGDELEYSFYAKACYLSPEHRRKFFQSYVESARPHSGYRLLPLLVRAGLIRTVWTTNFDGLVARACAMANVTCIEVGVDSAHRSLRPVSEGELRLVSLHGDFRYDDLKNTAAELQEQDASLCAALLQDLGEHDLVVVGYSGRDESLMRTLAAGYVTEGSTRLYWCGLGTGIPNAAAKVLRLAGERREAYHVSTEGIDDLVGRLALRKLDGEMLAMAKDILASSQAGRRRRMSFALPGLPSTSLVKSNAYSVTLPAYISKVKLDFPGNVKWRDWIDEKVHPIFGCAVQAAEGALLLAAATDIKAAFGNAIVGAPVSVALAEADISTDTRIQSLMRRALVLGIANRFALATDRRGIVWEKRPSETRKYVDAEYNVHRALKVRLAFLEDRPHAVLTPAVVVTNIAGQMPDEDTQKAIRNTIYGYQHNDVYDADLKYWTAKVTDAEIPSPGGGTFKIAKVPIYAGLVEKGRKPLPERIQAHAKQAGLVVKDANLVFCSSAGSREVSDAHPLRGLLNNRPWDYELTSSGLAPNIDLAVIAPKRDATVLRSFLATLNQTAKPSKTEADYLLDFPGFSKVFGVPLVCAQPNDSLWHDLDDTISSDSTLSGAKALASKICRALDAQRAIRQGAVTIIYVPARWADHEVVTTEEEQFNLHDFVKAYAARVGQSTQFLRERTTATPQPCRVRWWLSLAIYAKALRTPWRLESLDQETAFVGIGYSIDPDAPIGSHILLGCSHIYSARGEGLQFRLGRIEAPIMRGRNPFMSEGDARRTGDTIRQLFFDARMRLPRRVVVHKRTEFTEEEQRGFCEGLQGVDNVELVEINVEDSLRYLASKEVSGKLQIDKFPIPRGATVVLDEQSALLWVHGSAANVQNPRFKYYQGKRRIPAPLRIRRFLGESDLVQVVTEVLGLSKMNWNHFDYYSRVPATLESASAIAKVGTYLSGFGSAPYDYRLLI